MRLLFLNRSFWPDLEATGQFLTELCEDLSESHQITFVAGPSLHTGGNPTFPWSRERKGGVSVIRVWGTRLPKRRLPARMLNLATYYLLAALAALRCERPDIIVAQTDPPLLGAMGAMLKRRWGCRLVYNVRDLYPDVAVATGGVRNRFLLGLLDRGNRYAYDAADRVIAIGDDMRSRIAAKGIAQEKLSLVTDWVDCSAIRPLRDNRFRRELGEKFIVMYSGNLGLSQMLEEVIEAAGRLRDDQRIQFVLIGEGARKDWLKARARELNLPNVSFLPYLPKERLSESLGAADLHLIPLKSGVEGCIVPSKVYGILAAGRPFLAIMEPSAYVAQLAREEQVGFVARPGNPDGIADAIRSALANPAELREMGYRARRVAERKFDRPVVTARFCEELNNVMSGQQGPAA